MYDNVSLTAVSEEEELMLAKLQRMDICSTSSIVNTRNYNMTSYQIVIRTSYLLLLE